MSLSVEELNEIITALEGAHEAHVDAHPGPVRDIPKNVPVPLLILMRAQRATAELLAIKEAEPVATVDEENQLWVDGCWCGSMSPPMPGALLIRKPE